MRPSFTYGDEWIPTSLSVDYTPVARIRKGLPLVVHGDGTALWVMTHARDFAKGLVGLLGLSAAWIEDPVDSGQLRLLRGRRLQLPYSKTRAYFFMISMGCLATVISSVLDHARTHFQNPWLWLPTAIGVLATVIAAVIAVLDKPRRSDLIIYIGAMVLLIGVGLVGAILLINDILIAEGTIVGERFIRGAPFLAPLLFSNMGLLGLIVLLDPAEKKIRRSP